MLSGSCRSMSSYPVASLYDMIFRRVDSSGGSMSSNIMLWVGSVGRS